MDDVDYLEYVFFPDKLTGDRQIEIIQGLKAFLLSERFDLLPTPDNINASGEFKDNLNRQGEGAYTDAEVSFANDLASRAWGENLRSKKQQQSFANRIRKLNMRRILVICSFFSNFAF